MPGRLLRAGARMLSGTRLSATATRGTGAASVLLVPPIQVSNMSTMSMPASHRTPTRPQHPRHQPPLPQPRQQRRTLFIRTETTPNGDALKFIPGVPVIPPGISTPFIEYLSPRSTIAPPYPSQLASKLMAVDGVSTVFYGTDFITVTKTEDANWVFLRPEIFALVTEAINSGEKLVTVAERSASSSESSSASGEGAVAGEEGEGGADSLAYNENDSEVVGMIRELLATRIRPTIQQDGGDIEFLGFKKGQVMLRLRGACRTCDSSTATLKDGIENMLTHYIEEVESVVQVQDEADEISAREFAKVEEKLKAQGLPKVEDSLPKVEEKPKDQNTKTQGMGWEKML